MVIKLQLCLELNGAAMLHQWNVQCCNQNCWDGKPFLWTWAKILQHFFVWCSNRKTVLLCSPYFISNKRSFRKSLPVLLLASTQALSPCCRTERGKLVTQHFALTGIKVTGLTDASNWKLTSLGIKLILVCFNCKEAANWWAWIKAHFGKGIYLQWWAGRVAAAFYIC